MDLDLYLVREFVELDREVALTVVELRWAPLTTFFALVSSALLKGPLFIAAGLLADVLRRRLPIAAIAALLGVLTASLASTVLKNAFDRERPPDAGLGQAAAGGTPEGWSFPSGHCLTAFAGATAIALLVPRWRVPALAVAALIALSRIYLGVHFLTDVVAGAVIGALIGAIVVGTVRLARAAAGGALGRASAA